MQGILSNLRIKIIAWLLAAIIIVAVGIFLEEKAEGRFDEQNTKYVNDHDFDDILK